MNINIADLTRALADDELIPHFQPIVELRTGKLSGFEVLARWAHPIHGALLPGNMIELAEANGLIAEVARQVFTKAFVLIGGFLEPLRLSVNLSPVQLSYHDLTRQIEEMAVSANFPLSLLTMEITESALLSDLTRSLEVANELKELGCRLSLDDFGTGYSSLAHLQALPFNELKIDRSFVSKMTHKRDSRKIVAAIIGLGHSLGLSTVAEGIETEEQADMLLWLGSELGQGWHYGQPAPIHAVPAIVAEPPRPAAAGLTGPGTDWAVSSLEALPTHCLAQLQAIYDGAPVGLCFLDCNLRYVSMNQRLAEMNGASVAAHLGNTVRDMLLPEFYSKVAPFLTRALNGEAIAGAEVTRMRQDTKEMIWLLNSYQPAFDETDEVIGISVSVMDITEHKRAQAELQESQFVQRHLVELNRQVPWTMDPEGNDLQISSKWVRTTFSNEDQTRNLHWLEALHINDLKPAIKKIKEALRTGQRIDMEYRVRNTEGKWRWMRSRGLPRLGSGGEITRWYGSIEDIHDKKTFEIEARKTKSTMRALLKAVPGAVIIEEGKKRPLHLSADLQEDLEGSLPSPSSLAKRQAGPTQGIPSPVAKVEDQVSLATSIKSGVRGSKPAASTKKKAKGMSIEFKTVDDIQHAVSERLRLVTMLQEFAEYRKLG